MAEHTPTPWSLCGDGNCSCLTLACPDHPIAKVESGEWGDEYPAMRQVGASLERRYEAYMERIGYGAIDQETARANARFILKAVNSHDALVAALQQARARIEYLGAACSNPKHFESNTKDFLPAIDAVLSRVGLPPTSSAPAGSAPSQRLPE